VIESDRSPLTGNDPPQLDSVTNLINDPDRSVLGTAPLVCKGADFLQISRSDNAQTPRNQPNPEAQTKDTFSQHIAFDDLCATNYQF